MSNRKAINNNLISEIILSTDISVDCIWLREESMNFGIVQ